MESTERIVRTWMASEDDEVLDELVSEISADRTSLLNVVKALGEYLTSEDDQLRKKGVELLSSVISRCPSEKLNRQTVRVLTTFYGKKLDDSETVIPALKGLIKLVILPCYTSIDAAATIKDVFQYIKMKSFVQSVRFMVYTIIDAVMEKHREVLKAMGEDFISGYINLAEGEKDPRNLMVAFAIARVILIEFDISRHVESLFNITFCYFPITFRPPPNDPYGITTDDLRLALRDCMSATPAFGPLAIPVFLEKLIAGSKATKRDTFQALAVCLPVYGPALARASARKLWSAFKLEVFQPTDSTIEEEALRAIQILVKTVYQGEELALESSEDIQGLARDACEECIQILREPEKSQAKPATKILCSFITTTPSVSRYTVSQAVPHLVRLFLNPDELPNRPAVLLLLSEFVMAARNSMLIDDAIPALFSYKDEVLGAFIVGLKNISSRQAAITGLKGMITTKSLLSDEELGFIVHNVNEVLDTNNDADGHSEEEVDLLGSIAAVALHHIKDQTLPLLFSSLPDVAPSREAVAERAKCWRILSALKVLCVQPELFETLVIRLTTKLDLICIAKEWDSEPSAAYAHSILKTISLTLSTKVDQGHPDVVKYVDRLVPRIFNLFIHSALVPNRASMVATNTRLLQVAGEIITLVIQTLSLQRQEAFARAIFDAFIISGNVKDISEGLQKIPDVAFLPFRETSDKNQRNIVTLFAAAVIPLKKEVKPPVPDLPEFLDELLHWSLSIADDMFQRQAILQLISTMVNKRPEDLSSFLQRKLDYYWPAEVSNPDRPFQNRRNAVEAWIWLSKALLVRNHPLALHFTDKLFEAFGDNQISWDVAKAVGEIAAPDPILTKQHDAVIKVLYAQKFVNNVLPRIISGAKDSAKPQNQTASLVALTALVRSIPKATYAHEVTSLIPLLLRGLDLPDNDIRHNIIDTFLAAAEGDSPEKSMVAEHASTLVTSMLKNCTVENMPSARVRIAALRYLAVLPQVVRYDVLHPHKLTVIRELAKALDDPKRLVRKEAVDARTIWFKYKG
ncbi:ARM repeat-containing protein [Cyathus striatus]|nr:ARM repeat-containing protein [Cyathus striatus]